jgi:hypothetical protein
MIGARDMPFPRLNALSYWLFLFGGSVLFLGFFASGGAAKAEWYSYPPLSEKFFFPGHGQDLWVLSLHLVAISVPQHAHGRHELDAPPACRAPLDVPTSESRTTAARALAP